MSFYPGQRLIATRDLPELRDRYDELLAPPLFAGTEVWSFDGPTDASLRPGERAVTLAQWTPADPYQPWYPVPADAVEEA